MDITGVKILLHDRRKLKGFANIVLDNSFVIYGLKIIEGVNGYFVSMPCRRRRNGSFSDIAHPICTEFRRKLEKTVLDKYWEEFNHSKELREWIPEKKYMVENEI